MEIRRITITSKSILPHELQSQLQSLPSWKDSSIELLLEPNPIDTRGIDPTILVALVSFSGTTLGALISGLIQIAQAKRQEKLVIQGKNGARLEIPANTPPERIDELIEKLQKMDIDRIHISAK